LGCGLCASICKKPTKSFCQALRTLPHPCIHPQNRNKNSSSDDGDDPTTPSSMTRAGLAAIDPVLCGVIERARLAVAEGVRAQTTFKYDMNSR
jgi:hypothetical protein